MHRAAPSLAILAQAFFCVFLFHFPSRIDAAEPATLSIVTSLFPQYDFARRIAGNRATVSLLLPPGAESHSYEPAPSDIKRIADADLFIYTGPEMEPWAATLAQTAQPGSVVNASSGIEYISNLDPHDHEGEEEHEHEQDHTSHFHATDPHVWLDPIHAMAMVKTIAAALCDCDPASAAYYTSNADALLAEIGALDNDFRQKLAEAKRTTLVFGDRFAFAYFFSRYGLEEVGPYASCAPGAEPGVKAVIESVEFVRAHSIPVIYHEVLSTGRLAQVMADETGAELVAVDSLHNPTLDQLTAGYSYVEGMRANMAAFARGLE